jgi:hypothetical protein
MGIAQWNPFVQLIYTDFKKREKNGFYLVFLASNTLPNSRNMQH